MNLWRKRTANNYAKSGQDLAMQLKRAIKVDDEEKKTGWKFILLSESQANIYQAEEYNFMMETLTELNHELPKIRIDFYHYKHLRCSIQDARMKKKVTSKGSTIETKDKIFEKPPIHRLPLGRTNPSDSFKYLCMKRDLRKKVSGARKVEVGDTSVR
jgi:hypothetical protein